MVKPEGKKMRMVDRTLDVLEAILKLKEDFSLTDLVSMTGLSIHTVRRFVGAFVDKGYIYQKKRGGNYYLGYKLLEFNGIVDTESIIRKRAVPFLEELGKEIHATIHMAILDGRSAVTISIIPIKGVLFQVLPDEGSRFPLHATSLGKILLSYLPKKERDKIINNIPLDALTDNTITDKEDLKRETETIRRDGFAFDDEEYEIGLRGAAAPLRDNNGNVVAGIAFWGASFRISRAKMRKHAQRVKDTALEISRTLGYKVE